MGSLKNAAAERKSAERAKRDERKAQNGTRADWQGFVNYKPTEAERKQFDAYSADGGLVLSDMDAACVRGYTFSLKYGKDIDGFQASVMRRETGQFDSGWTLTMRTGSAYTALAACVFALTVVGGGSLDRFIEDKPTRSMFDF